MMRGEHDSGLGCDRTLLDSDPDYHAILARRRLLVAFAVTSLTTIASCGGETTQEGNADTVRISTGGGDAEIGATGGAWAPTTELGGGTAVAVTGGFAAVTGGTPASVTGGALVSATGGTAALATGGAILVPNGGTPAEGGSGAGQAGAVSAVGGWQSIGGSSSCGCQGGMCQGCT